MDKNRYEEYKEELRDLIKTEKGITQEKFANDYYMYVIGSNEINEQELEAHTGRFKKLISDKSDTRSPERIAGYLRFFKDKYCKDGIHTQEDRNAAWSMYIELDTRIATKTFDLGDIESALTSLAKIFSEHRVISKNFGHRCRRYYEITNKCLDAHLRPFTSMYHEKIKQGEQIEPDSFKVALANIQLELIDLKEKLYEIAE